MKTLIKKLALAAVAGAFLAPAAQATTTRIVFVGGNATQKIIQDRVTNSVLNAGSTYSVNSTNSTIFSYVGTLASDSSSVELDFNLTGGAGAIIDLTNATPTQVVVADNSLETQGIEIGMQMAAHAIGPDQHQGAHKIPGRLLDMAGGELDARCLRLGLRLDLQFFADGLADLVPVAVQCGDEVAAGQRRPIGPPPGGALGVPDYVLCVVLQAFEERAPLGVHRLGIGLVAGIKRVDVIGIAAVEKGSAGESRVRVLA